MTPDERELRRALDARSGAPSPDFGARVGKALSAGQQHPNLIIMDLQLPDMSGLDVTRMLKADDDTRDIAIIATTAYALRGDEEKIRASGCDGYMAKPIAVSNLLDLIETLITRSPPARIA